MPMQIDEQGNIEICLYREGEPLTAIALYTGPEWKAGREYVWTLHPLGNPGACYSVRMLIDGQLGPHWWAVRVAVFDAYGAPLGTHRPALIYTLPWQVPTVVWFPHRWDGDRGPFVLTFRIDRGLIAAEQEHVGDAELGLLIRLPARVPCTRTRCVLNGHPPTTQATGLGEHRRRRRGLPPAPPRAYHPPHA